MIKQTALNEAFLSLSDSKIVHTSFGVFIANSIEIRIIAVGRLFAIALYKTFRFNGEMCDWLCCRSYPMSYKAAHRLVCSL